MIGWMDVRKKSKLIRSGYYVFSGRGESFNCLCCSALALLLHSTIIWPIQYPTCAEKGFAEFLNQKCWHPRSILGAKRGGGGRLSVWHSGRDVPQDWVSHRVLLQHYNRIRGNTSEPHLSHRKEGSIVKEEQNKKKANVWQQKGGTKSHPL